MVAALAWFSATARARETYGGPDRLAEYVDAAMWILPRSRRLVVCGAATSLVAEVSGFARGKA